MRKWNLAKNEKSMTDDTEQEEESSKTFLKYDHLTSCFEAVLPDFGET